MRYCGSCGAMLDPEDKKLQAMGQCPNCGTPFIGEETTLLRDTSPNADTAPVVGLQAPAKSVDTATETLTSSARNTRRRGALSALGALLLFLLLLLVCENSTLLQPLVHGASTETTTSNSAVANTTQSAGTQSTETLTAATQGAITPLATPSGNGSAPSNSTETSNTSSATATPGMPRATATPAPQPVLTVAPITININLCVASITQFTVRNSGTGVMSWSTTTTSTAVVVLPTSGTLMPGQQTTVSVTSISTTTQVTVHAPQAQHAPQVVSINCG